MLPSPLNAHGRSCHSRWRRSNALARCYVISGVVHKVYSCIQPHPISPVVVNIKKYIRDSEKSENSSYTVGVFTRSEVAELATDHSCIIVSPVVVSDSAPFSRHVDLHSTFPLVGPSNQTNITIQPLTL